jgi:hypothetical protein
VGDTCHKPCTSDSNCDDGKPCNGREFCNINNCAPGVPVVCDDGNQCNGANEAPNGYVVDVSQFIGQCCSGVTIPDKDFGNHNTPDEGASKSGFRESCCRP